jgi:hypothetical protein
MPEYHFNEVHSIRIRAAPDRIFRALEAVTPGEVRWLHTLFWTRSLPHGGQAGACGRRASKGPSWSPSLVRSR